MKFYLQRRSAGYGRCVQWLSLLLVVFATAGALAGAVCAAQDEADPLEKIRQEARLILMQPPAEQDLIRLVQMDLALSDEGSEESAAICREVLRALAISDNLTAMEHVHSVFENEPERRGVAAWALSQATTLRPADLQDWRYMVRSLTVVRGNDAVDIMKALQRFRPRANKPQWVRQVMLIGLTLSGEQQEEACRLLKHWTGMPRGRQVWALGEYQAWFAKEHPDQPEAVLPVDSTTRKWTMASLGPEIAMLSTSADLVPAGEAAFIRAGCQKCHRRGKVGEAQGPDLTTLGWRRQKSEILEAILFPSHHLNEEYPAVTVVLKDGRSLSGMMSAGTEKTLSIVSSSAVREEFPREDVEQIVNQKISNMPEGTLEPLSLEEIRALFSFLTSIDGIPRPHGDELE